MQCFLITDSACGHPINVEYYASNIQTVSLPPCTSLSIMCVIWCHCQLLWLYCISEKWKSMEHLWHNTDRGQQVSVSLYSPQIPHALAWNWTLASI